MTRTIPRPTMGLLLAAVVVAATGLAEEPDDDVEGLPFVSLSTSREVDALHGEVGVEGWLRPWATVSAGLSLYDAEDSDHPHCGMESRLRACVPAKLSPFVGIGLFLGKWEYPVDAFTDGADNDGDGWADEPGEEAWATDFLLAAYPEAGVSWSLGNGLRLAAHVRSYVTTAGRDSDRVMYGFSLGYTP